MQYFDYQTIGRHAEAYVQEKGKKPTMSSELYYKLMMTHKLEDTPNI